MKRTTEKATKKRNREIMKEQIIAAGGDPRTELPRGKDNPVYKLKRRKLTEEHMSSQRIVVDCAFDEEMTEKDVRSLVSQVTHLYGKNRVVEKPLNVYITSFNGKLAASLRAMNGFEFWTGLTFEPKPYIDMFPKDRLVYLSAESDVSLTELDDQDIYIIGGLVDHNRLKGICHKKATEQGIRTARLPIDEYMDLKTRKVLTVNHVFEILLAYSVHKDWTTALETVIPKRKGGTSKQIENAEETDLPKKEPQSDPSTSKEEEEEKKEER